jgi:hypothetical protein
MRVKVCECGEVFHHPRRKRCDDCQVSSSQSTAHRAERKRWAAMLDEEGSLPCTRCQYPVTRDQLWHLDHSEDRSGYLGVAHARCNLQAGAAKSNRMVGRGKVKDEPVKVPWVEGPDGRFRDGRGKVVQSSQRWHSKGYVGEDG